MKPFDLNEFKRGFLAITRTGRPAKFACYDEKAGVFHKVGAYIGGELKSFSAEGIFVDGENSCFDLVGMAPTNKYFDLRFECIGGCVVLVDRVTCTTHVKFNKNSVVNEVIAAATAYVSVLGGDLCIEEQRHDPI